MAALVRKIGLLCAIFLLSGVVMNAAKKGELKPRLVVMTDICPVDWEPDDMESAIHLLASADQFEIEGIFTTVGWNCDPYPEEWSKFMDEVVDAYAKDVVNLMKRSKQKDFMSLADENGQQHIGYWPSASYIRSRSMAGSHRGGIRAVGADNDSPGSELLIQLADEDDPRPIYVAAWGGANTLAQAIWKVKQTRSPEALREFLHKFRVYTISDQDMEYNNRMNRAYSSHQWMRREFQHDLLFVWDEGTWQKHCDLGKEYWSQIQEGVQGKGAMGKVYPNYKWGVEGDTPSFLNVYPNGLSDPDDPTQAGWGGTHRVGMCPDSLTTAWTSWEEPLRSTSVKYKERFFPDELNDFCARMQWAEEGRGNKNPVVKINGRHLVKPLHVKAKAGKTLTLDASKSFDPDGDALSFRWWQDPEASAYPLEAHCTSPRLSLTIPQEAKGKTLHYVCEVHDDGPFHLVNYMRVIVEVK